MIISRDSSLQIISVISLYNWWKQKLGKCLTSSISFFPDNFSDKKINFKLFKFNFDNKCCYTSGTFESPNLKHAYNFDLEEDTNLVFVIWLVNSMEYV